MMKEELGDVLWYIATLASRHNISLEHIAKFNIKKNRSRWVPVDPSNDKSSRLLDERFPVRAQLPRKFMVRFTHTKGKLIVSDERGKKIGDPLTDNNYFDDGYRFHDIMHFAFSAVLGWSPVARKLFKRKRPKLITGQKFDEDAEDGGRAKVLDEAIVALCYNYWKRKKFSLSIKSIDYELLRSIKQLTDHLEVEVCVFSEWERAILKGYQVWNSLRSNSGGWVIGNMNARDISYSGDSARLPRLNAL